MKARKFYHLVLPILCLPLLIGQGGGASAAEAGTASVAEPLRMPPRNSGDITRLLAHYKPHPDLVARAVAVADAQPPEGGDKAPLMDFYWQRGRANGKLGRAEQQIADFRQAAGLAEPGSVVHARILRDLASAEATAGNLLSAAKASDEAATILAAGAQNQGSRLAALQASTYFHFVLGDFSTARSRLKEAETVYERLRSSRAWNVWGNNWTAIIERARAEIFRAEGRYVEAEGAYRKALAANERFVSEQAGSEQVLSFDRDTPERARHFSEIIQRTLAGALIAQGKLAESEVYARRALQGALERVGRDSTDTALGLSTLAAIFSEQGRPAEAEKLAEEALNSFRLSGASEDSIFTSNARKNLASAMVALGRYKEAIVVFERNRDALKTNPELWKKVGSGHLDWILAMLRTGNQKGAEGMAKAMYEWAEQRYGRADYRTATSRGFYAMTLGARGEHLQALGLFRESVPVLLLRARDDAEAETGTVMRQRRVTAILEGYIATLAALRAGNGVPSADLSAESFRVADVARSSVVQRALSASAARATIADPKLAELARGEQDALRRANALSVLLTQLLGVRPEQQLPKIQDELRREILSLQDERDRLRRQIVKEYPEYAELVSPQPVSLEQARKLLHGGEVLVTFYLGETESYVWAVDASGRVVFSPISASRSEIARSVQRLRRALDPGVDRIDAIPAFDLAEAYRLYGLLLSPVLELLQDARLLLLVPHADLGSLPFAILPTAPSVLGISGVEQFSAYRAVPWLARRLSIEQLPSVTALASLRRLPSRSAALSSFVGFGDPLFSAQQAKQASTKVGALASRGLPLQRRNVPQLAGVESASLALLPRLPDTGEEVRQIARVLNVDPAGAVFLNAEANEQRVLATDYTGRRVVMFATHGLVPGDLDGLTQPALALTSPEVVPGAGDGLLSMEEILGLKLDADWVVLSACNTAAAEEAGAEAVSGLGRAFFYAGARALLVSSWPVETVAARMLMTELFRRQVAQPQLGKAEAFRQSMLALMDGPGYVDVKMGRTLYTYAHPLFWAPFVVIGD